MFLGIDIAKHTFDAALLGASAKPKHKRFSNTTTGFSALMVWLQQNGADKVHACLEATGTYGEALALFLYEQGHTVSVVNPAMTHFFAESQLTRTRTDKADAQLIARFCQMHQPAPWTPPAPEMRQLQALVRRLETLLEMQQMEKNRLEAGTCAPSVKDSLEAVISSLDEQIQQMRKRIKSHIDQHPSLKQQRDLLVTIPGISDTTAAAILAELQDVKQFTGSRQVAAFVGLVPKIHESGTSVRGYTALSKRGTAHLRKALFLPAIVSMRCNPAIAALAERLQKKGKRKMLIVGAAMRKLLVIAFGVLKSGKPFDPSLAKTA